MSPQIKTHLLPKQEPSSSENHGSSTSGIVFNVSTSIIGAGIMSMPAAFKVLGIVPAFLIITIIAWLSTISVGFLMKSTLAGESTTYAGVMKESFGKTGSVAAQIATMVATFGCMIVFSIIIGDVLSGNENGGSQHLGVLQEWFGSYWWNTRIFALLFIYCFVLLPLVLCRRVEKLAFSSAVSFLLAVLFVVISSVLAISALVNGQTKNPRLFPELNNGGSFWKLFTASPVIVTAFTFHFNVHPIGFELKDPLQVIPATKISVILCAAIYFATGLFGYLLFGDATMSDILVNFDQSSGSSIGSLLNDIVRLSYALHLMLVFPLMNFSLRANLDELLFPKKPSLEKDTKRFIGLTLALLICCFFSAIAVPDIWYFFQFLGSTTTVSIAFIFPAAIVLRNIHGVSTSREKIVAAIMLVLAVATSIIAISTNLYSLAAN
ncbi:Amino acid transporter transmembrane domain [Arabidopsis thaliana x Arabidopsis arenosa]|uniref:Amino acid transporter transmembrane domain n=1 Tax=Arabidopsis thaliana x Arabidopsis arenosa TaxID=1240361 RepID=A0A8T1ZNP4_9BRAS|nr:Amino acid transporter transmembrane domain [Arabidopsis thaliana x Arabidopsis arenosa]